MEKLLKITFARPAVLNIQEIKGYLFGLKLRKIWFQGIFFAGVPFSLIIVVRKTFLILKCCFNMFKTVSYTAVHLAVDFKLIFKVVPICY